MYYAALAVIACIFIWRIIVGFKKGMVREIVSLIAVAVAVFCVILILSAIGSYLNREIGKVIQFIVILFVTCLVYRLVNVLFTSLELIAKLPVIKWLDKLLGMVVGAAEAVIIIGVLIHFIKSWGLAILA